MEETYPEIETEQDMDAEIGTNERRMPKLFSNRRDRDNASDQADVNSDDEANPEAEDAAVTDTDILSDVSRDDFEEGNDSDEPTAKAGGVHWGVGVKKSSKKKKKKKRRKARSTGGSSQSSNATSAQLVRNFISKQGTGLDPGLSRFRSLYLLAVLSVLLIVIVEYVEQGKQVALYGEALTFTNKAGLRGFFAVTIAYMTHSLVLIGNNIQLPSGLNEAKARLQLNSAASSLRVIDTTLYSSRSTFSAKLKNMYEQQTIELRSMQDSVQETDKHTLYDASSVIAGLAKQAAQTPLSELIEADNEMVYFLTNNIRPGEGEHESHLQALDVSTEIFASQGSQKIQDMALINSILAGASILSILVLLVAILRPLVNHIESNKESVLEVLTAIPREAMTKVRGRYGIEI